MTGGRNIMARFLFIIIPLVLMVSAASAQQQHERDACARDVSRFCRAHMNDSDDVVLACLKQHRDRLSKACAKVLAEHGH
jgi:DNA-binding ferritin-like protein (Dps family)